MSFWMSSIAHGQAGTPLPPLVPDDPEELDELLDEELEVEPLLDDDDELVALFVPESALEPPLEGGGSVALVSFFCGVPSAPGGMSEVDSAHAETAATTRTRPEAARTRADFIALDATAPPFT